jgi:hypothetical protein
VESIETGGGSEGGIVFKQGALAHAVFAVFPLKFVDGLVQAAKALAVFVIEKVALSASQGIKR